MKVTNKKLFAKIDKVLICIEFLIQHIVYFIREAFNREFIFISLKEGIYYYEFKCKINPINDQNWEKRKRLIEYFIAKVASKKKEKELQGNMRLYSVQAEFIKWLEKELKDLINKYGEISGSNKALTLKQQLIAINFLVEHEYIQWKELAGNAKAQALLITYISGKEPSEKFLTSNEYNYWRDVSGALQPHQNLTNLLAVNNVFDQVGLIEIVSEIKKKVTDLELNKNKK